MTKIMRLCVAVGCVAVGVVVTLHLNSTINASKVFAAEAELSPFKAGEMWFFNTQEDYRNFSWRYPMIYEIVDVKGKWVQADTVKRSLLSSALHEAYEKDNTLKAKVAQAETLAEIVSLAPGVDVMRMWVHPAGLGGFWLKSGENLGF